MKHLEELNLLIDKASAIAGSDYKLAKMIGAMPQNISNWRHERASCSPENRALLAAVAGLDPIAELARATVEKHEGTSKGDLLMRALGKSSRLTGAIAGIVGAVALAISSLIPQRAEAAPSLCLANDNVHYVKSSGKEKAPGAKPGAQEPAAVTAGAPSQGGGVARDTRMLNLQDFSPCRTAPIVQDLRKWLEVPRSSASTHIPFIFAA